IGSTGALIRIASGKAAAPPVHMTGQTELTVIRLMKEQPAFAVSALCTVVLPLLFAAAIILLPGWLGVYPAHLFEAAGAYVNPVIAALLFVFGSIFVVVFLQMLGLLITGELLQRRLHAGHHNFFVH